MFLYQGSCCGGAAKKKDLITSTPSWGGRGLFYRMYVFYKIAVTASSR